MASSFPVYLFDVDGTLTDSAEDICGAVSDVLRRNGYPPQSFDFLRCYIGLHLKELFADILPDLNPAQAEALLQQYRSIYLERRHTRTRVFPGIADTLSALGGRKSTAATKSTATTRNVLDQFGLLGFFEHVQGTDGFPAKPAPDVTLRSLDVFGVEPSGVLFIGDSVADILAGKAAGVRTCGVAWGYGDHGRMRALQPDYWVDHPSQILHLVP
jgi:HAD superfamily hydrolase (TIGR01509 family)